MQNDDLIGRLESQAYKATDRDIENLAALSLKAMAVGKKARGVYLSCLVAALLAALRKLDGSGPDGDAQLEALADVGSHYRGLIKDTLLAAGVSNATELNERSNFARTAEAAVRLYIERGGDARELNAKTVTKLALREGALRAGKLETSPPPHRAARAAAAVFLQAFHGLSVDEKTRTLKSLVKSMSESIAEDASKRSD